ncbi:MAG: flavin reductase family protein [Actinobacteria bacterium]|nr:flavin reductase family protein [Actinomycetota bacterium]
MGPEHPSGIHDEHPFVTPEVDRDPVRRLRGRLAAPVTVWTAGTVAARAGLTISSVLIAEGEPARVLGLMSDLTDLWETIQDTGSFVMHVLDRSQGWLSDRFAFRVPSPGGPYAGLEITESSFGPVLAAVGTRAYCRVVEARTVGHAQLVDAAIEDLELADLDPLVHFRGRYAGLSTAR